MEHYNEKCSFEKTNNPCPRNGWLSLSDHLINIPILFQTDEKLKQKRKHPLAQMHEFDGVTWKPYNKNSNTIPTDFAKSSHPNRHDLSKIIQSMNLMKTNDENNSEAKEYSIWKSPKLFQGN
ncbi:putative orfan [Tupanvirus soda lake]|uniref:Orfan n=2 Tax=Tupanvirus TaxID=2094720 RepID=A0AC62ACX3_9VIRU|nr:putative orfan [Tupanvirus soda lake]QKU35438.1 putative orfan [Tupanvirus soda lake]